MDSSEQRLTLAWSEHDGPLVQEPTRKGFGSVLLQRVLGRQLGGQVEVTYAEEGDVSGSWPCCLINTDAR